VAAAMVAELSGDPVRFFYHLGDIVYLHGEEAGYLPQFLEPYAEYASPIFAIPGNHDGDRAPGSNAGSLQAFIDHFCTATPIGPSREARFERAGIGQPNVYWTLVHDWITIVGLYTNVPDGGRIGDDQLRWLTSELRAARSGATLILALHHPVYSADSVHGSNLALGHLLDQSFALADRAPDAMFAAHAHNYQRFTRTYLGREIPYVVAGTGGFHTLHEMGTGIAQTPARFDGISDVKLEVYQDQGFGFMTVTAGPGGAEVSYSVVKRDVAKPFDRFSIAPR
jgi:hypothetical protein